MIYTFIPYSPEKKLYEEYNRYMALLPNDNDFACILDHDVMFTTYDWYNLMTDITFKHGECGCFVATTNRIGGERQRADVKIDDDIRYNRYAGRQIKKKFGSTIEDFSINKPHDLCGFLILLKKAVWKKIGGFEAWDKGSDLLGVDSKLHRKLIAANEKVYIMKGVYLYHWYSGWDGQGGRDKSHLI